MIGVDGVGWERRYDSFLFCYRRTYIFASLELELRVTGLGLGLGMGSSFLFIYIPHRRCLLDARCKIGLDWIVWTQ